MLTLLNLLSAVTLLIWGTHIVRTGILRVYGSNLRQVIGQNMSKRWLAFIAGILVTAMVQSSNATAMLVTSFVGQGLMGLMPALATMLGADVGTEHGRQGGHQPHQALADKGGHQHCRGVAALHHGGHQDTGDKRQPALGHVLPDDLAQVGTVDPQDAGTDDVRAPDKQGHGGKQIEQGQHARPPV